MIKPVHRSEIEQNFPFEEKDINHLLTMEDICMNKKMEEKIISEMVEYYAVR
jgi:hypothetical protein